MSGQPVISGWLNGDSISLKTDTEDYLTVLSSAIDGELLQQIYRESPAESHTAYR